MGVLHVRLQGKRSRGGANAARGGAERRPSILTLDKLYAEFEAQGVPLRQADVERLAGEASLDGPGAHW